MVARRARAMVGSVLLLSLLAAFWAGPAAAADCALSAPAYANVGSSLTISGSGFPASTAVDIEFSIQATASDAFAVQSDSLGAFEIALTPEGIDIGVTTIQATAGSTCTVQATYTVLAAGETPPPAATQEPAAPGTGAGPTPPRTDAVAATEDGGWSGATPWVLALVLVVVGSGSLLWTRSPRQQ